jgi:hypothetical protein
MSNFTNEPDVYRNQAVAYLMRPAPRDATLSKLAGELVAAIDAYGALSQRMISAESVPARMLTEGANLVQQYEMKRDQWIAAKK